MKRDGFTPRFGQGGPVGVARFETFLRRLLQVKGQVAPIVHDKIGPSIDVDGSRIEYGWLRGEMPAQISVAVAPVAAQFSLVSLYPGVTAPGQLYVIHGIILQSAAAQGIKIRIDARLAGTLVSNTQGPRDARWVPSLATLAGYSANNAAAQITQEFISIQVVANTALHLPIEYVLVGGGQSLNFECDTVNTNLRVNAWYTERACEASEL